MSIPERLAGKVAIVTGAGRGIGRTIADTLASEGASVAVAELNMEAAQESVDLITEAGGTAVAVALNLGKVETIAPMIDQVVAAFGRLDILVNNAGLVQINPFLKVEEEEWDRVMNVNLKGTFFCLQAAAKQMEKQGEGGRIISMSSISGRGGRADSSVYAASKMGIISITRSAALALADKNILVNAICPGIVPTPMWDQIDDERARLFGYEAGTARAALVEQVPLKRVAEAEEVSAVVAFLASSESSFITGQAINVDGGMEMD